MAQINIVTTEEERTKVLQAIKKIEGEIVSVTKIAALAGLKHSRVRYVIVDLIDAGLIERVPRRLFNKRYIRYSYNIL